MNYEIIKQVRDKTSLFPMSEKDYDTFIQSRLKSTLQCTELIKDPNLNEVVDMLKRLINQEFQSTTNTEKLNETKVDVVYVLNQESDEIVDLLTSLNTSINSINIITTNSYLKELVKFNNFEDINTHIRPSINEDTILKILGSLQLENKVLLLNGDKNLKLITKEWLRSCNVLFNYRMHLKQIVLNKKDYGYEGDVKGLIDYKYQDISYSQYRYIKNSEQKRLNINYPNVHDTGFVLTDGLYSADIFNTKKQFMDLKNYYVENNYVTIVIN